ncbi:MAG TPA: DUF1501 domain-containing protein [Acidimicrobiales bacterium]|nr:DUF1501 domain-containing protein [Acidimicrobiales bacterium]
MLAAAGYTADTVITAGTSSRPVATARPAQAPASPAPARATLVLITLYGGNDGLNMVVPYADPTYAAVRPSLAVTDPIHLNDALGLHPALTGLKQTWDAGHLAIVLGVGYPDPNLSHFRSMDIWQSAVPETDVGTGWLGRWLDGQRHDPMRALSLGPTLPLLLQGAHAAASAIPTGRLTLPGGDRVASLLTTMGGSYGGEPVLATEVAASGADLLTVLHDVSAILAAQPPADDATGDQSLEPAATTAGATSSGGAGSSTAGATSSGGAASSTPGATSSGGSASSAGGALGAQLDVVARLVNGGAPTQLYSVSLGGFDTHADEKSNHDRLMGELDAAITSFLAAVAGKPGVVVATYSEFGRRVASNASGGTDHGTAAPLFVAGTGVKGGFYGTQPSLTNLDQGNLTFSTDFRSVYATLAEKVLGVEPASVLNGASFAPLPFL